MDVLTPDQRQKNMKAIRGRGTKPERRLGRGLHERGFRYRLNVSRLAGSPDLVLPRYNAVIFAHGCFWHRHPGCRFASTPSTRPDFWKKKFDANVSRDNAVRSKLLEDGWRVAVVWECALRRTAQVQVVTDLLAAWLRSSSNVLELGEPDSWAVDTADPGTTPANDGDTCRLLSHGIQRFGERSIFVPFLRR